MQKGVGEGLHYNSTLCGKINTAVNTVAQCKNSNEYAQKESSDYIIYMELLTTYTNTLYTHSIVNHTLFRDPETESKAETLKQVLL